MLEMKQNSTMDALHLLGIGKAVCTCASESSFSTGGETYMEDSRRSRASSGYHDRLATSMYQNSTDAWNCTSNASRAPLIEFSGIQSQVSRYDIIISGGPLAARRSLRAQDNPNEAMTVPQCFKVRCAVAPIIRI